MPKNRLTYAEFCAGYGGLGLAVEEVFGAELAWYSEFEKAPSAIMAHHWPDAPNHGDMTTIDFTKVQQVDILSGGTPCQDLSHAGRRAGMRTGTRSGLWESMREAIATIKPTYVVWENVRGAYSAGADSSMEQCPGCLGTDGGDGKHVLRALGRVLGDLSDLGYDTQWRGLRAADVGAPHGRFRVFVLATRRDATNADDTRLQVIRHARFTPTAEPGPRTASIGNRAHAGSKRGHDGRTRGADGRFTPLAAHAGVQTLGLGAGLREGGPERVWRGRPDDDRSSTPAADAAGLGSGEHVEPRIPGVPATTRASSAGSRATTPDASSQWAVEQIGKPGRSVAPLDSTDRPAITDADSASGEASGGRPGAGDTGRLQPMGSGRSSVDWGTYAPAIRRWEAVRGTAPAPTELTAKGKHRLSARFAEWMMGIDPGWVTDVPGVSRNEQLKAVGNGVVPAQAAAALRHMLNHERRTE